MTTILLLIALIWGLFTLFNIIAERRGVGMRSLFDSVVGNAVLGLMCVGCFILHLIQVLIWYIREDAVYLSCLLIMAIVYYLIVTFFFQ